MPDLTGAGAIAALKADTSASPVYGETYNLGPTGLRGWIYIDRDNVGQEGLITDQSRQILVTVASTPGSAVLAVDDVILGAMAASSGTVPLFTSDCRKAFGAAIGEAEKTGAGMLRVKRWRGGTTTDENIPITIMGDYSATAPYGNCPKSALILANAITKLNQQTLSGGWDDAVSGLALLAAVPPGVTPTEQALYAAVKTKLQNFAHSLAPANLTLTGCDTWNWGYTGVFLSEYYLRTVADGSPDSTVLHGINEYTVGLAKGQSKYGTFGHGGAEQHADGSLHGSISWYGPVNSAGLIANLAIVLGKKALLAGGIALDAEIDPAIERGSKFFAYFVNKGGIPYGEHEPWSGGHASNGKDAMAAVFFGLQDNKPVETEYFTRMSTAGWVGREYGHTGQGFSYIWAALGAAMGGDAAASAHLNQVRWHLDLERRTDGSFVYDGGEQYGANTTSTYLGSSSYSGLNPNACFVLTYALPLKRIYLTGRNANPANTLDPAKVANEIAAATYERDCVTYPVGTLTTAGSLMAAFSEYDPVVRHDAAAELGKPGRMTATQVTTLIALVTNGTLHADANVRQGACETLGNLKSKGALAAGTATTTALTALGQRLSDADLWVRGKAANALRNFGADASPQLAPMLTAFAANATDPNVIVWDDPIQIANGYLADTLFQALSSNTNALTGTNRTTLLYPAVRAGLKQPDGMARMYLGGFIENNLTLADVQAVAPALVAAAAERSPADRMFSDVIRYNALNTLAKYKIEEGIPLCLVVKEQTWHGDDWLPFDILTNTYRGAAKDALPTLYKWQEHIPQFAADGSIGGCCPGRLPNIIDHIASTIAAIENDTSPPTLTRFKTLTPSASPSVVTLPTTSAVLNPGLTDLDAGAPNFVWSKVSGPGAVSFNPGGMAANATCTASFNTPGTYVLRVTAVDRSILDYRTWITYSLGYFDFETYNEILGAATANLSVTVVADPNRAPLSQNQSLVTPVDTALGITLTATDPDGNAMTYGVVTSPAHGTLTGAAPNLTYTPAPGFTGADSFTFKANDGKVDSVVATIAVDVGATGNRRPLAVNQAVSTAEDTAKAVTLAGTDPDSDPLTYQIVSGPVHGALIGTAPNLTYLPAANYPAGNTNGTDSFTFTVRDAALTSMLATVTITVTPVNDPPQALAQSLNVSTLSVNPITLTGLDPENYALASAVVGNPSHGTLSGTAPNLSYQPAANYHGADSFTFTVTDSEGVASAVATVSITVINDPPAANAQSVELQPNTSKAVTLTGSDNCNDALTYTVLTQPAHGTLTGTAPNLTYTPATDYTGADSFTFKANDGVSDSPVATVTLTVAQWQTWTNVAAGAWSAGASWSGGVAPTAGGSSAAALVFNTSAYSGASSNDLAGTFQLNRVTFGSALPALALSGNALSFVLNSATLPQLNQNSANAVTLSNGIALAANTTLGGSGAGALNLSGIISGAGSLTKTCPGILTLSGTNTYSGGTTVSAGTLVLDLKRTNLGTGAVTLAGGTTFYTTNFEGNSSAGAISNSFNLSGGLVTLWTAKDIWLAGSVTGPGGLVITGNGRTPGVMLAGAKTFSGGVKLSPTNGENPTVAIDNINSLGTGTLRSELASTNIAGNLEARAAVTTAPGVTNPIELAAGCRLVVKADGSSNLWLSGPIRDAGSLVKIGTATLTVSGANTYTGNTTVSAGILACSSASSLGQGPLAIASGAKVALNFTATRRVSALSFNGTAQPNGIYSATTSPTYFSGTGTVTVAPSTSIALALTGGFAPSAPGASLTFTATVAGSAPMGNVAFYAGATLLGTSALNASFQASLSTGSLAVGTNNITASYAGDTNNGASTSAVLAVQVIGVPAPPTNLAAMAGNNVVGLTWSAPDGASGYFVKRATVSGGPYLVIGTAGGTSYTDATALNGTTYYYVVSATNNSGEGANSGQVSATPTPPLPSTTTLASSLGASGAYGATVTFTATVTVTGGPATGTVTFKDGATVLGTGTLSAGQATCTTGVLAAGSHSITASYGGSLAFESSTSGAFGYTVSKKPVTITGVTAANKSYDGSTAATLTGGTLSGVINGDTVTVVAGTGAFASASVGTWTVTASAYALGGTHAGNYVLSAQPVVVDATITAVVGVMITTKTLNISAAATGAEILNTGILVAANHVGATTPAATIMLANGLTFGGSTGHLIRPNGPNFQAEWEYNGTQTYQTGWSHGSSNNRGYTITNTAFDSLMDQVWWVNYSGSRSDMEINGLTIGHTYRLQLISENPQSGTVVVEGSAAYTWSGSNSVATAIWTAQDTTLNMQYSRKVDNRLTGAGQGGEVLFNGYALHDITPPSSAKDITSFTFPTYGAATITGTNIDLTVPHGAPLTAMAPTYTVSPNSTGSPVSGTPRNFTTPQTYTVTGQDLSTKTYTVTVTPLAPPAQPANLVATPGSNSVGLTWSAASGATGYNVKRASASGGSYATLGTTATTSYSDGTALNGTTYYYVVAGTNGGGEGANSAQASATPTLQTTTTSLASSLGATGAYGTAVTFTATVTGASATGTVTFKEGATVLGSGTLASGTATLPTSALAMGAHSITASYGGDATFAASVSTAYSYTVTAKPVTITGVTAAGKIYDATTTAILTGGMVSGVVGSETVTVAPGTGTFSSANAGSQAVTATAYALAGTHKDNYVLLAQPTVANATITAKALTVAGITAAPKVYDGTTTALLGGAAVLQASEAAGTGTTSDGKPYTGDSVSVTGTPAGTLAAMDAGVQAVTLTGNTLGGAQAGNYTLTQQTGLTQTVTPKGLLVSGLVVPASKPYDGNTAATVSGTAAGLLTAEAGGTGSAFDGKPYTGDTVSLGGSATGAGTYNSKDVATAAAVTYSGLTLTGTQSSNYSLQVPATITPVALALGGNRNYDGTTAMGAGDLSIQNKVGADDVGVVSGGTTLGGKHAGPQVCVPGSVVAPARVGTPATGSTGTSAATSFNVTLAAPANGNTLVAVISTRSTSAGAVSNISQSGGAPWTRATQTTGTAGTTTEIWHAPNIQGAGTTVTINLTTPLFAAAVVTEYSGVLAANAVDQTANTTGSSTAALTGSTATTTQANELWIGGIGLDGSTPTLGTPLNSFTSIGSAQSSSSTASGNAKVHALEKLPGATGTAGTGGAISGGAGAIALRGTVMSANGTTTVSPGLPAGLAPNDLMIACVVAYGASVSTPTTLSGWTLIKNAGTLGGSNRRRCSIMYKLAGSSENAPTFAVSGAAASFATLVAFSGVDTTTPLDVAVASLPAISASGSSLIAVAGGSITTVTPNAAVILFGMGVTTTSGTGGTWTGEGWSTATSPGALSELFDMQGIGTANNATSIGAAWATQMAAGPTGAGAATLSSAMRNGGLLLALRPAAAVPQWSGAMATFKPQPASPSGSLALGGTAANNYTLAGASGSVTIHPLPITVTAATETKTYDGTSGASGTPTITSGSIQTGDTAPVWTQAFASRNATASNGAILTPAAALVSDGNGGNNYTYNYATSTGTIDPLPLTVTAVMASKTYDGTTSAAGTPTLAPALLGTDVTTTLGQAFLDPNAGTGNKVIIPNITINDGNGGANYAVAPANFTTGTITPAPAAITLGSLVHIYDGNPKTATATTNPAGKAVGFTYDGSAAAPAAAGSYAVVATITDPNYTGTASGTLVISADALHSWRAGHFTPEEIAAGLADDERDPDGDGFINLTEYTLGTDPRVFTPQPLVITSAAGYERTLTFIARSATGSGYEGLTRKYELQQSSDLTNPGAWTAVPGYANVVGNDQEVVVTLPGTGSNKFYRLNVRVE